MLQKGFPFETCLKLNSPNFLIIIEFVSTMFQPKETRKELDLSNSLIFNVGDDGLPSANRFWGPNNQKTGLC